MTRPRTLTRLVSLSEACDALGICKRTFARVWAATFTDPRSPEDRRPRVHRRVYEDELALAVNDAMRGKALILNFRRLMGRL